ncbi:MAG: 50S ribosomal protein L17 [Bacteroidales bacterium]|jgi:large subunit ribosomal protein L17|nr:50S ribosomal protein L17 [Bacteroidales bacterium]
MRHLNAINHLGRKSADRKALLANMAASLILHKRITTTTAKARALRRYVEPLITKSKDDSTHSRRVVFSYLENKNAVSELFREVAPRIAARPGGYTRILKTGTRLGDSAEMCIIELVDFNENMLAAEGAKAKTTRRRRSPKKKGVETTAAAAAVTKGGAKAADAKSAAAKTEPAAEDVTDQEPVKAEETAVDQVSAKAEEPETKPEEGTEENSQETENEEKE